MSNLEVAERATNLVEQATTRYLSVEDRILNLEKTAANKMSVRIGVSIMIAITLVIAVIALGLIIYWMKNTSSSGLVGPTGPTGSSAPISETYYSLPLSLDYTPPTDPTELPMNVLIATIPETTLHVSNIVSITSLFYDTTSTNYYTGNSEVATAPFSIFMETNSNNDLEVYATIESGFSLSGIFYVTLLYTTSGIHKTIYTKKPKIGTTRSRREARLQRLTTKSSSVKAPPDIMNSPNFNTPIWD